MTPSNILRAMQPLRSCLTRPTITSFLLPSLLRGTAPRTASTATTQQQPETASSITPPSLRKYPYTLKTGTVVSVGRMERTVRVSLRHTVWDAHLRKSYPKTTHVLVADPRNSLREGDVIEFASGFPKSRRVRHVVERIVAPFGSAVGDRPSVMTREEREAAKAEKRAAKAARREEARGSDGEEHVGRIRALIHERVGEKLV